MNEPIRGGKDPEGPDRRRQVACRSREEEGTTLKEHKEGGKDLEGAYSWREGAITVGDLRKEKVCNKM